MPFPPGPRAPALAQTVQFVRHPTEFLLKCRERFGLIFTIHMTGAPPTVCVGDPAEVQAIYRAPRGRFSVAAENSVLLPILGRDSLLLLDGEPHRRARKLLQPAFAGERTRAHGDIVAAATLRATAAWRPGAEVVALDAAQAIAQEVVLRAVFGVDDAGLAEATAVVRAAADALQGPRMLLEGLRQRVRLGAGRALRRHRAAIDRLAQREIDRRRAGAGPGDDLLSRLLAARDEQGRGPTDDELRDELCTALFAGQRSTAIALSWALHWVLRTPGVLDRLRAELASAGDDPEAIAPLAYLSAVCDEALRLVPVFPFVAWVLDEPMAIGGFSLPAGARVAPCIYLVHRDARSYPDPEAFKPERFLRFKPSAFEYIPFGGGARRCAGAALALHEMKLALATLLRRFDLELIDPTTRVALHGPMLAPDGGVRLRVAAIRPPGR